MRREELGEGTPRVRGLGSSRSCWQSPEDEWERGDVGPGQWASRVCPKPGSGLKEKGEEEGNLQSQSKTHG